MSRERPASRPGPGARNPDPGATGVISPQPASAHIGALSHKPLIARLAERNNVPRSYT